jgi:hypothetical protein
MRRLSSRAAGRAPIRTLGTAHHTHCAAPGSHTEWTTMLRHRNVNIKIEFLERLSRAELRILWEREFAEKPPRSLGRDILALGIAYARQEGRYGGLAKPVAKELDRLLARVLRDGASDGSLPTPLPRNGTVLVREWHGAIHHVTVLQDGFLWNGKTYRSLSSIARAITGTKWNGPRFFGMRDVKKKVSES